MSAENGSKTRIIYFLLGILQAIILGWVWNVSASVQNNEVKVATVETDVKNIVVMVKEMKEDLRAALKRR